MLYSVDTAKYIDDIPHTLEYRTWLSRLPQSDLDLIRQELIRRIEGDEIHTSSWMPGSDWTGSIFYPIYERACLRNQEAAAMCFGLILWQILLERQEVWGFGRYEKDGIPIKGLTYFRLHHPPSR
jgi:hypothetical protein